MGLSNYVNKEAGKTEICYCAILPVNFLRVVFF